MATLPELIGFYDKLRAELPRSLRNRGQRRKNYAEGFFYLLRRVELQKKVSRIGAGLKVVSVQAPVAPEFRDRLAVLARIIDRTDHIKIERLAVPELIGQGDIRGDDQTLGKVEITSATFGIGRHGRKELPKNAMALLMKNARHISSKREEMIIPARMPLARIKRRPEIFFLHGREFDPGLEKNR